MVFWFYFIIHKMHALTGLELGFKDRGGVDRAFHVSERCGQQQQATSVITIEA